jgi:hypothetical protein
MQSGRRPRRDDGREWETASLESTGERGNRPRLGASTPAAAPGLLCLASPGRRLDEREAHAGDTIDGLARGTSDSAMEVGLLHGAVPFIRMVKVIGR